MAQENFKDEYPNAAVVLIPTCNRLEALTPTLQSITECDGLSWLREVIIINNGQREHVVEIQKIANALPYRCVVLDQPNRGIANAINLGLDYIESKHRPDTLLLKIDDDVRLSRHWLTAMLDAAQRWGKSALLGGRIIPDLPAGTPNPASDFKRSTYQTLFSEYDYGEQERIVDLAPFGPNMGFSLGEIHGLRCSHRLGLPRCLGEETQFFHELRSAIDDGRYIYVPKASVWHVVRPEQLTPTWILKRGALQGATQCLLDVIRNPEITAQEIRSLYRTERAKMWTKRLRRWLFSIIGDRSRRFRYQYQEIIRSASADYWKNYAKKRYIRIGFL